MFSVVCDKNRIWPHHTYKDGLPISEPINHRGMWHHETLLLLDSGRETGRPTKIPSPQQRRTLFWQELKTPRPRGERLSAGSSRCLLTRAAHPEGGDTPQTPTPQPAGNTSAPTAVQTVTVGFLGGEPSVRLEAERSRRGKNGPSSTSQWFLRTAAIKPGTCAITVTGLVPILLDRIFMFVIMEY